MPARIALTCLISAMACACCCDRAWSQQLWSSSAPGVVSQKRLIAEPSIADYDQPVRIMVAGDGAVSWWEQFGWSASADPGTLLGMQVGPVYRLKVNTILRGREQVVYPTVEMLDRLYPPAGLALRHPVKIVISQDDIEDALAGGMITKVVYLENPDMALPYRQQFNQQPTLDVSHGQDPLSVAVRFGRPFAIVRIGSRQPLASGDAGEAMLRTTPVPLIAPVESLGATEIGEGIPALGRTTNDAEVACSADIIPGNTAGNTTEQAAWITGQLATDSCHCEANPIAAGMVPGCSAPAIGFRESPCFDPDEIAKLPKPRRDEYICDGNDRNWNVVADSDRRLHGLDLEDTVARFDSASRNSIIAPSNRVCIYAPRFAAVRRVFRTTYESLTQPITVAREETPVAVARKQDFASTTQQNVQLQSNLKLERASAVRDQTRGLTTVNRVRLVGTRHLYKPFEDLQIVRFGEHSSAEFARLSMAMQSAVAWESDVSAQITINRMQPIIVNDVSRAEAIVGIETDTSPDLRLCKLASRISAQSGDSIDFTIRFDNIGREILYNIKIVDNLSPRLEYVEGSAECSVIADFSTTPNEAGSKTLEWELLDPLELRTGGIIRFQCIVR